MPRRTHWNDHTLPIGSGAMFTDRAGRSRRAFKIKEPRFQYTKHVAIAVAVMIVACGVIYLLAF